MGEGISVDRAVGVRRQVHWGDDIAGENTAARGVEWRYLDLDDRSDPFFDPGKRVVDAQQGVAKGETIIAQLPYCTRPVSWARMKPATALASDSGSHGRENSANC